MDYKIEKGVPVPVSRKGGDSMRFPFRAMQIGDSFAVPISPGDDVKRRYADVGTAICAYKRTRDGVGKQFTTRLNVEHTEVRVWRIATPRETLTIAPKPGKSEPRVHTLSDLPPKRAGGTRR